MQEVGVTLIERIDEAAWWALAKPGRRLAIGDRIRFGHEGRVCLLGTLEATVEEKQPDGRIRLAFGFHGAYLDEAIARDRRCAAAALYRRAPARRRARPGRLSDGLCGRRKARWQRRLRACISRRSSCRSSRRRAFRASSSRCMSGRAPFCRSSRTTRPSTRCMRSGECSMPMSPTGSTRHAGQAAASWRSGRRRCACSSPLPMMQARSAPSTAQPISSSRRATGFAPSTC